MITDTAAAPHQSPSFGSNLRLWFQGTIRRVTNWLSLAGGIFLCLILMVNSGCSRQARISRYLARAGRDFQLEQFDRAEIEYLTVLKLAPRQSTALGKLGIIYETQGKLLPALVYLRKAVEIDPANMETMLRLGLLDSRIRNAKDARLAAIKVIEKDPSNEEALLLAVDSAADAGEMQETLQLIEQLRQNHKDCAAYHLASGALYLRQQDFTKAESELKNALAIDPKSAGAYLVLGNLCFLKGDRSQAEQALRKSAELSPWHSARKLSYADFQLKIGAPEEGKRIVRQITDHAPDYLPAWLFLAEVAAGEHQFEDCDRYIEKILGRDPSNYDALLFKGNLLISRGDGTNGVVQLERAASIYKTDPQVFAQLAVAHLINLDVAKARASLNQALALNPNFADATLLLAELDIRQGQAESAIASMKHLVEQQPQLARAHLLLADAYLGQRDSESAIAVYRRMMEIFPTNPQVPLLLGIQLAKQNRTAEARRAFEKSSEIAPESISAFEQLVNLDLVEKQYTNATERLKSRLQKNPRAANPWLLFAKIHLVQNEKDQAEAALLKAIELEPDLRNPYLLLADLYRTTNRREEALKKLSALLAKNANDTAVLVQVGVIESSLDHFPAARDAYEKLLAIDPKSNVALNNLACLYGEHFGQLDRAYELACKSRRLYPNDPYTADTLGWILYRQGDYLHALGSLQESARHLSAEPEVQFHLGMAYYMTGQEEQARHCLQSSLQTTNNFAGKDEALRSLAVLDIDPQTADSKLIQQLEDRVRDNPRDSMALSRIAAIHEHSGRLDEAARDYEKALKVNSQNPAIMLRLSELYGSRLGNLARALQLAKEAHNLAPDDPRISYALGRFVYRTDDKKWAVSLMEEAASKLSSDPQIQYDLAQAYYAVGQVEQAQVTVQKAIQSKAPFERVKDARIFLSLIMAAQDRGMLKEANTQAQHILNTDSESIPALFVSALVKEQQGNYTAAQETYEAILKVAPLFSPATKNLALLYAQHFADDKRAYDLASKVREMLPDDTDIARMLGILTYRLGKDNSDFARSVQLLRQSALKRSDDSELFYYLGLAQYQTKELQESKKALERALSLNLEDRFAGNARQVLAKLN